ncbi:helix-turn-helix domain-containing protein [Streptomyces sp. NPDC017520]|uniref:helix-turn-helix domain-containing protein n=1 Tax=Streptomyces sp. NPDC017520 TaxID=3364998 RepID=UPI00378F7665
MEETNGVPSEACRVLFWGLHIASRREDDAAGFAEETEAAGPVSVEVSAREWAERVGCSPQYVRRLARTGRVPARRIGRAWLIAGSAAFVARGEDNAA